MEESTIWWLLAGGVIVAELLTGTFYLLMVALGLAAAALVAHTGLPLTGQIVTAAAVGGGAVVAWHYAKRRRPGDPSARADRSVNLDVGETIVIDSWNADGTTTVKYRGATWTAIHRPGVTPSTGMHRVAELVGSRLLVDPL
ncbi:MULTISPECIES: NfeD family protein [unclassified Simplicispira]|jgi:membrane protein implicated in regulation of membrane protease activity|uniref:NfeD family protein n=1 Tax=unclassified Simplicispira TaxID=2630407 RepID=UPI000D5E186E|nr:MULTISPECIES: NfeD family protein [unclassified Simplicispira]MBH1978986.1 NfeD family protein [Comamonadaceae bacterium]PVY55435.1 membrane protein implicated in regulation of membrane protease activity [Simplicispira sp. 125]REG16378.1 membrane protein implicated in regulation of membrane protease activity [Simplicispira sp. 110]